MKKHITVFLMLALLLCSYGCSATNLPLDKFEISYAIDNVDYSKGEPKDIKTFVEDYFTSKKKGFIARITLNNYDFIQNVTRDEDTNVVYIDGYAECRCRIEKVSAKYNSCNVNENDIITIKQAIYLEPMNEKAFEEMLTDVGAYNNGSINLGRYKIPDRFVNERDYRMHIKEWTIPLAPNTSYYAFVYTENDNLRFVAICPSEGNELTEQRIPALSYAPHGVLESMLYFSEFIKSQEEMF